MKLSDVPEVLEIWKEVGLYEGTHSIDSFLEVDPNGFYVAINDDNGKYFLLSKDMFQL